ncbi:DNA methyltransferase [Casimicrobium huifangae]|uniref:DNA methyltransferase n=1 Tax=Casimicrobium huifangae TaxID=2591109 RepID=UPI00387E710E
MVESQLRGRGVRGEILWKPESASGAAKSKKTTSSGSTAPSERSVTSAKTADESVTRSAEQQSLKSSEQLGTSGLNQIRGVSESFQGCTTSDCANPSSLPMEGSAPAAESVSATFSPLTTSTAEEPSTASKFMGRCTPNCAETDSRPDTESFAGIATGLTGSMEIVRINRDSEGFFLWPKGLPEFVPGSPLTVAANVLAHGTGGLNIAGCRIDHNETLRIGAGTTWNAMHKHEGREGEPSADRTYADKGGTNFAMTPGPRGGDPDGRWPANVLHDGSEEVLAHFPDCDSGTASDAPRGRRIGGFANIGADSGSSTPNGPQYGDTGSAARFFYCAKASKADRDEGLELSPTHVLAMSNQAKAELARGNMHATGSGMNTAKLRKNHHPTVKPTDLMRYLMRLVTPPGGTALDPFMGSGSTGKAALLEHFKFIGIERDPDYFEIAKARIDYIRKSGVQVGLFGEAA